MKKIVEAFVVAFMMMSVSNVVVGIIMTLYAAYNKAVIAFVSALIFAIIMQIISMFDKKLNGR